MGETDGQKERQSLVHRLREEECLPEVTKKELDALVLSYVFKGREEGLLHNPYDQEEREMRAIEEGDVKALEESILEEYEGEVGRVASDSLRNAKNLCIVVIALSSRAAIRGGLPAELAFSMSDIYIRTLEECKEEASCLRITRGAEYRYARLVRDTKGGAGKEESTYVHLAKDYVHRHLQERLRVEEVGEALGLHPSYLSSLFREQTGQSLKRYILLEKLRMARQLLTYSEMEGREVAAYLGFVSQSHLGEAFKRETGMTMGEYRRKFGKKERG